MGAGRLEISEISPKGAWSGCVLRSQDGQVAHVSVRHWDASGRSMGPVQKDSVVGTVERTEVDVGETVVGMDEGGTQRQTAHTQVPKYNVSGHSKSMDIATGGTDERGRGGGGIMNNFNEDLLVSKSENVSSSKADEREAVITPTHLNGIAQDLVD